MYPLELLIMKSRLRLQFSSKNFAVYATSHTNAFVLVVGDVMCVFSAETGF